MGIIYSLIASQAYQINKRIAEMSMQLMTKQIKGHLISYFQELICSQNAMDMMKSDLVQMKGFHPKLIFKQIARNQASIQIQSLRDYLQPRIACNQRELYSIFQRFDHLQQGSIHYHDFKEELTPKSKGKHAKKKRCDDDDMKLQFEVEAAFIKLIVLHIKAVRVLDVWRKQLTSVPPYIIFKHLDTQLTGKIGPLDLIFFFIQNKEQLNHEKAKILFNLIRKNYKELNLQTFCENIHPLQLGYYEAYNYEYSKLKTSQFIQKQRRYRQAKQQEMNYLKQRNTDMMVGQIHKEAALIRQKQLEDRIAEQIKVYNMMKYQTKLKYRPDLSYEAYLLAEKENIESNRIKIDLMQQEIARKQAQHKAKMMKVSALRDVQLFKSGKANQSNQYTQRIQIKPQTTWSDHQKTTRQLEGRIRVYRQDKLINQHRNRLLQHAGPILRGNLLQLA